MNILHEVSSTVIKNTYKVFTELFFDGDTKQGEQIYKKNGEPVLVYSGAQQTVNQFAERALAEALFRNGADRRFEPGAAKIAIKDCHWNPFIEDGNNTDTLKLGRLKRILEYITQNHNDRDKISNYLNDMSYDELYKAFKQDIDKETADKIAATEDKVYSNEHKYKIVRIDSFEEAKKYREYPNRKSLWCLTYSITNYNSYTEHGKYATYFCLRDDIDTVPYKRGPGCPLDEYGKSMLCIIVDMEGNLSTCTTRWNHVDDKGERVAADRGVADEDTISEIVGVNFRKTFKPYTEKELEAKKYKTTNYRSTFEDLTEHNNEIITDLADTLTSFYTSFIQDFDEYDDNGEPIDPENFSWEEIFDRCDWDVDFGPITPLLNLEKTRAIDDAIILTTNSGLQKMVNIVYDGSTSITDWVDEIKPIYKNGNNIIYAVKEHNKNYYQFIVVRSTGRAEKLRDLETNFDGQVVEFLKKDQWYSYRFSDNKTIFVKLSNGKGAQIKFDDSLKKAETIHELDLPDRYIHSGSIKTLESFDNNIVLYSIKNNDSGLYNILGTDDFKLKLSIEDECKEFLHTYCHGAMQDNCIPVITKDDNKNILSLKTFKYIFEKPLSTDENLVETEKHGMYSKVSNVEKINDNFYKCDLSIINSAGIHKLENVYLNDKMQEHLYHSESGSVSHGRKCLYAGLAFTDAEHSKFILFDTNGHVIYRCDEANESLKNCPDDELKKVYAYYVNYYNCYYGPGFSITNEAQHKTLAYVKEKDLNLTSESFVLKYAAYLLD